MTHDTLDTALKAVATLLMAVMFAAVGVLGLIYTGPLGWLALVGFIACQLPLRKDT